jgi:hypothetical protein
LVCSGGAKVASDCGVTEQGPAEQACISGGRLGCTTQSGLKKAKWTNTPI